MTEQPKVTSRDQLARSVDAWLGLLIIIGLLASEYAFLQANPEVGKVLSDVSEGWHIPFSIVLSGLLGAAVSDLVANKISPGYGSRIVRSSDGSL